MPDPNPNDIPAKPRVPQNHPDQTRPNPAGVPAPPAEFKNVRQHVIDIASSIPTQGVMTPAQTADLLTSARNLIAELDMMYPADTNDATHVYKVNANGTKNGIGDTGHPVARYELNFELWKKNGWLDHVPRG